MRIIRLLTFAALLTAEFLGVGCFLCPAPRSDYRVIHQYALNCDAPGVENVLSTNRAAVNLRDDSQRTPLHDAASRNCTNVITLLLKSGAKLEAKDEAGETPLHVAAQEGFVEAARVLLDAGARVNARDNKHQTPLKRAIDYEQPAMAQFLREHGGTE